jgi:hypothetical protein
MTFAWLGYYELLQLHSTSESVLSSNFEDSFCNAFKRARVLATLTWRNVTMGTVILPQFCISHGT